ncbi:MAG: 16S rRNA (adenine(1518)-N(6)/adenine(1519)-N(6))-dimethyltransferase RsmA [Bacteroidales bacterium]|jgi:16S rRNA (adenine1518-N6/adenine1519-N6)-dimethyltransferase|nr:16S rRNA (adenine(1518)-N(6)/adenine(1519)-N(6))-dimethyltransferase RsmA [Bacteroidales bacterium]MDD4384433.1 16S rRNA (adenine(1518)-N(6)/adenine(1519)-N(6))-dimethyltransferase RsmA [Bacteroidales bacterium]MDY0196610.1 16S rRNA (adenine(1518)-N(6)/adenine(1519)-N(6))-dimethyltransferase RsmA [Tenuifilaceae bacterium]
MQQVRPKKQLGQHFLNDKNIAQRIVSSLDASSADAVLEIGPGMGVLTEMLLERFGEKLFAAEVDIESIEYLSESLPLLKDRLLHADFLSYQLDNISSGKIAIIGNFPYNISSQIFFKVIENRDSVTEVVGMVQREVGLRICEPPGSKTYGILSVLLQAYFDIQYLFTVSEGVFTPPPKVKSAVIRLTRNNIGKLSCNEKLFHKVVKAGFNQRRKMLRNSIRSVFGDIKEVHPLFDKRPEQLSVAEFVELTNHIEKQIG